MAKKSFLVLFLFLLVVIPLVSSAPPFVTTTDFTSGYAIEIPHVEYIKIDTPHTISFHVFNISDGVPITNTTAACYFHLYNQTGNHIIKIDATHETNNVPNEWDVKILQGNFSSLGYYPFVIQCNSSSLGGYKASQFIVTGTGYELTSARATTYAIIFFLLIFIFIIVMLAINKLPSGNDRDDNGQLMSINNLKYFRGVLLLFAYLLIVGMFYLSSNLSFSYLGEQLFAKMLFTIFQILSYMILPIIIIWVVWIFAQIIDDKRMRRLIEHGIYETKGGKW
jgi:hypothetical protein